MRQMIVPSLILTKRAPHSDSAVDTASNCKRNMKTCIVPFNLIGCFSWGGHQREKCPAAQLFALGVPMLEATERMLSIIS